MIELIRAGYGIITGIMIPMAFALCVFYFFWGMAKYIRSGAGGEKAAEEGKQIMIWGIVGLFIAFSIWGIIAFIRRELTIPEQINVEKPLIESATERIIYH